MARLYPPPAEDVDIGEVYRADERRRADGRPWVAVNMVTSVDGAVSVADRSKALSGPADKELFHTLRAVADVILVGAGTVRAERYGPPRTSEADQRRRVDLGQQPFPRIAVVSGTLDLDPEATLFRDSPTRPLIFTTEHADAGRRLRLEAVADVVPAGSVHVEPDQALDHLAHGSTGVVICEGGPTLNGALFSADVVDEVCFSLAPLLTSGDAARMAHGLPIDPPRQLQLARVIADDGFLFLRYLRA